MAEQTLNAITLVGQVGRDPVRNDDGTVTFSLSTEREVRECRDWHRIVVTDKLADWAVDLLEMGDRIRVEGSLHYDSYERDGVVIPTAEVHVSNIVLLNRASHLVRIHKAIDRVEAFIAVQDENDAQTTLTDMLVDLRHWALDSGANWTDADRMSEIHAHAEQTGEDV